MDRADLRAAFLKAGDRTTEVLETNGVAEAEAAGNVDLGAADRENDKPPSAG